MRLRSRIRLRRYWKDRGRRERGACKADTVFRDIAEGKIKTVKRTVYKNGDKITTKTEYISDVDTRIKARKELDRLLGISALQPLGQISAGGNVNIMIVDASKKDAVEDSRNNPVFMEMQDKTEEVDGEVVIVADEEEAETAK